MATKGIPVPISEVEAVRQKLKKASTETLNKKLAKMGYLPANIKSWTRKNAIDVILIVKGLKSGEAPAYSGVRLPTKNPKVGEGPQVPSALKFQIKMLFEMQERSYLRCKKARR